MRFVSAFVLSVLTVGGGQSVSAQSLQVPGISADQLMKLQQQVSGGLGTNGVQQVPSTVNPQQVQISPQYMPMRQPSSPLEKLMSEQVGTPLEQFGYDQLGIGKTITLNQVGGIQDDYVLGVGDEVVVSLRGQENNEYRTTVNRDGRVILPRLNPVTAAGRTFGDFKRDMAAAIHRAYVSTEAFVSVGQVRQISVMVSGEVADPGMRTMTGLSSVVDAILVSGGVLKSGSLRNVRIIRNGRSIPVDLYGVLSERAGLRRLSLADGDRIVVPPIGDIFAVTGDVRRPGIFELPAGRSAVGLSEAISLAARTLVPGAYRISVLRVMADGKRRFVDVTDQRGATVRRGEVLNIRTAVNLSQNEVTLKGAVQSPGGYALGKYRTLHDLLPSNDTLLAGAYTLFGFIDRIDSVTHQHRMVPFSPIQVIDRKVNIDLATDDTVYILTKGSMRTLIRQLQVLDAQRTMQDRSNPMSRNSMMGRDRFSNLSSPLMPQGAQSFVPQPGGQTQGQQVSQAGTPYTQTQPINPYDQSGAAGNGVNPTDASANAYGGANPTMQDAAGYGAAGTNPTLPNAQAATGMPQNFSGTGAMLPGATNGLGTQSGSAYGSTYATMGAGAGQTPGAMAAGMPRNPTVGPYDGLSKEDTELLESMKDLSAWRTLYDYRINIVGEVNDPGLFLVAPNTAFSDVLAAAGGFLTEADRSSVEITSTVIDNIAGAAKTVRKSYALTSPAELARISLIPKDEIIVRRVFTDRDGGSVVLRGQVRYPGVYNLLRGERLSSVLVRAGGLTQEAYPYGAVFLRTSLASLEQQAHEREAKQIEDMMLSAMGRRTRDSQVTGESFTAIQGYVSQLRAQPALGRMAVQADPAVLAANPGQDPMLENGDVIFIPQRPYTVTVLGEVLQPNSVPYKQGLSADEYIKLAGGFSQLADESVVYIVLPNGAGYRNDNSWFSFGHKDIPPGSTVYVGRDISGYDLRQAVMDSTSILASFATTFAAIAALNNN